MVALVRGVILVVTLYHPPPPPNLFDPHLTFKRLHYFFLLEPLKNRFGDVITHYLVPFWGLGAVWGEGVDH